MPKSVDKSKLSELTASRANAKEARRPVGRPTKYRPEFCQVVLDIGDQGGWLSEMAEACNVSRPLMDAWAQRNPEFLEALTRAKQKSQAWFEKMGRLGLTADKFNSSLWQKQMSARHPNEYTEKREHSVDNPLMALLKGMRPSPFPVSSASEPDECHGSD